MKIKQKMKKKTRIILASTLALALVACATVAYIYRPQQNNTDANNPVVKESTDKKEDSKKVDDNSTKPEKRDGYSPDKPINTGDQQSSGSKKSVVYRKQTAIEAGLYPNTCPAEDYDLFSSFAKYGKLANVAYPIFRYRISDGSISAQRRDEQNLLAKKLSYRSWDTISPNVISRSEIKQSFNYYMKSSVTDDFGISLKHAYIFVLMRVGYRMIKKGNVLQGLHQLWNIASTGRTAARIVVKWGLDIIKIKLHLSK